MKYIRSIILTFAFIVFGTGSFFFNFIIFPLAKIILNEGDFINFSSATIQNLWKIFIKFMSAVNLIKVSVKNIDKLKSIKNKVIVATHPSFIDILILMSYIPRSTCFVKKALTKNFILKNIVNSIFISNDIEIEEIKTETKKYLDKGFNIIIFPMGTRHRQNEHLKIKKGAALVAVNSDKDIIPIKITSSEDFLFINQPFYSAGNNIVDFSIEVLEPIEIKSFYNESDIIMKKNITNKISDVLYN